MGRPIVVLRVGDRFYGVDVAFAQSVIALQPVTPVPQGPVYLRGVMNLRGSIVPVIDLAERLGLPSDEPQRICVVEALDGWVGLLADDVLEVAEVEFEEPVRGWTGRSGFVSGVTNVKLAHYSEETEEALVMILDLPPLLDVQAVAA